MLTLAPEMNVFQTPLPLLGTSFDTKPVIELLRHRRTFGKV
jgi:hypothetical protein